MEEANVSHCSIRAVARGIEWIGAPSNLAPDSTAAKVAPLSAPLSAPSRRVPVDALDAQSSDRPSICSGSVFSGRSSTDSDSRANDSGWLNG